METILNENSPTATRQAADSYRHGLPPDRRKLPNFPLKCSITVGRNYGHLSKNSRVFTQPHSQLLRYGLRLLLWLFCRAVINRIRKPVRAHCGQEFVPSVTIEECQTFSLAATVLIAAGVNDARGVQFSSTHPFDGTSAVFQKLGSAAKKRFSSLTSGQVEFSAEADKSLPLANHDSGIIGQSGRSFVHGHLYERRHADPVADRSWRPQCH
jgi:hypothetical protein